MGAEKNSEQGGKKSRVSKDQILELLRRQQESIEAYQAQVEQLQKSETELKARLDEREAHSGRELERLREDLTEATERQAIVDAERQALLVQLQESTAGNARLSERLAVREAELKEAVDLASQIQEEGSTREQGELAGMLTEMQQSLSTMQTNMSTIQDGIRGVPAQLQGLADGIASVPGKLDSLARPDAALHKAVAGLQESIGAVGSRQEVVDVVESMKRELAGLAAQIREMVEPEPDDISAEDLDLIQSSLHETAPRSSDAAVISQALREMKDEMTAMLAEMSLSSSASPARSSVDEEGWQTLIDRLAAWEGQRNQALIGQVSQLLDSRLADVAGHSNGGGSFDSNHHTVPVDEQAVTSDPAAADRLRSLRGGTR